MKLCDEYLGCTYKREMAVTKELNCWPWAGSDTQNKRPRHLGKNTSAHRHRLLPGAGAFSWRPMVILYEYLHWSAKDKKKSFLQLDVTIDKTIFPVIKLWHFRNIGKSFKLVPTFSLQMTDYRRLAEFRTGQEYETSSVTVTPVRQRGKG